MCLMRGAKHLNIELEHTASEAASERWDTAREYLQRPLLFERKRWCSSIRNDVMLAGIVEESAES